MAEDVQAPEPDRLEGAPHPRETGELIGQDRAEQAFLSAWRSDRLHHAWLIRGPEGVGKATLAYRIAKALLAEAPEPAGLFGDADPAERNLDMQPDHPVARRVSAQGEARLAVLRRPADPKTGRLRTAITVDEVRKLKNLFQLSAADGGWRVAIVDPADEMNTAAANALLKLLEEPPPRTLFLLVSHAPARLAPTIRSRCRTLDCDPLAPTDLARALSATGVWDEAQTDPGAEAALSELAGGSVGRAFRLATEGGIDDYTAIVDLMGTAPDMDRAGILRLASAPAGAEGGARLEALTGLSVLLMSRMARAAALSAAPQPAAPKPAISAEGAVIGKLAANPGQARIWAEAAARIEHANRRARAVNLDPGQVILDMLLDMDAAARDATRCAG